MMRARKAIQFEKKGRAMNRLPAERGVPLATVECPSPRTVPRATHFAGLALLLCGAVAVGCRDGGATAGGTASSASAAPAAAPFDPASLPEAMLGSWVKEEVVGQGTKYERTFRKELIIGPTSMKYEHSWAMISGIQWTCRSATSCSFKGKGANTHIDDQRAQCEGTLTLSGGSLIVESASAGNEVPPDGGAKDSAQRSSEICTSIAQSYPPKQSGSAQPMPAGASGRGAAPAK